MHSRCRTSSIPATPTLMSVEDGPTVFWTSLYVSNHPVVNMPPGCNVFTYEIYTHVCMYVCIYVCMSSIVGSFEAVSCETLPPKQLKVSESFLQQSEMFIASLLPSNPYLSSSFLSVSICLPLCFHSFFLLRWYTQVLYLWGYAPLPALGANWASGTEQVWAVLSKLRGSLRVKMVSTCEWVGWSTTLNYCSCMCMLKEQLRTHAKYHGFITFELPYDVFPPACTLPVLLQREHHVHCGMDPLAADPKKQTTASISFLLAP